MSKRLIKIMSICALVILAVLAIVGVSIMATEAVGVTLTVYDGGIETLQAEGNGFGEKTSEVTITIDGKVQKSNKITVTKRTEVEVTFAGEGYDFLGWYKGSYKQINRDGFKVLDEEVSNKTTYKFEVSKNTVLTAVRDVKRYNVTYAGFYDDETTAMDLTPATLEYNQPFATVEPKAGGHWAGWYAMEQGVAGSVSKTAVFENSGDVTVYPAWSGQMLVEYIKGDKVIASERIFESAVRQYQLLGADTQVVKDNIAFGYKFAGWKNQVGGEAVTSLTYDANGIKLVLNEELIAYTLNVKYNAVSDDIKTITFDVNNGAIYDVTRDNYTLKGFDFNGTVYPNISKDGDLAGTIVASGLETIDLTAVWECDYKGLYFDFSAIYYDGVYKPVQSSLGDVEKLDQSVNFVDAEGDTNFDVNANVYEYFIGAFENLQTSNGEAVEYTGDVELMVEGTGVAHSLTLPADELTFANILSFLKTSAAHGTLEGVASVSIDFFFEVKA